MRIGRLLLLSVIGCCILLTFVLRIYGYFSAEQVVEYVRKHGHLVPYIMAGLYLISPVLFLPTFYLTILAGVFWGPFWGVLIDVSGATAGSVASFWISRYVAGDFVNRSVNFSEFKALQRLKVKCSWKLNAFMRLNPIFPSALIGYFFGLTSIKLWQFSLSTFVFLLPPCAVVVALGSSLGELLLHNRLRGMLAGGAVVLVSVIVWIALYRYGSRALKIVRQ